MPELPPQYNPKDVEERRYQWWEASGLFAADAASKHTPYTIVIPPPNVTGILHMGHALNNTIQDILIRFKRMQGCNALWIPGTDHAGIATQNVVERALAKEGKKRQDLGRDAFIQRVWQWKEQYGNTILYQLQRLGSSCDWRRTRFTMDQGLSDAVADVFLRLYQRKLIYRGNYIINWCPRCQTALADEEAPREQTQGKLYHIKYPLLGQGTGDRGQGRAGSQGPGSTAEESGFIEVATTRPETMLGDTAIAVHPADTRYKSVVGKCAMLPIVNRRLPIIADEAVDREFGTGAVKVTPAHDPVDFQLGRKHHLEFLNVMTDDAHMTGVPAAYEGLERFSCRSKLIVDLEQQGFLGRIDEHVHNVGHCYRCRTVVEPRLSPQWFVKMKPLAEPAIKAVRTGAVRFFPGRWTKVYLNWMEHIEDWCISRQIWWGHRLPVWYCDHCRLGPGAGAIGHKGSRGPQPRAHDPEIGIIVSKTTPARCPSCGGTELRQDEDVLDTWFSSWLWPFSTLGWPEKTKDLQRFYPTDVLVTAQEIIFFWVARMIMAGYFCMGKPPFSNVYIHGTVRDITGKKMSKSLGNAIDPLDIINQYGTDALRYTLVTATAIGQDVFLSEERFTAGRNFANKVWNAARFALSQSEKEGGAGNTPRRAAATRASRSVPDRWIVSRLQRTIDRVTTSLEAFLFSDAATSVYDFLWHDVCDWYLEIVKHATDAERPTSRRLLLDMLETSLRLLHPVMPFVTEELWQHLTTTETTRQTAGRQTPHGARSIMVAPWPKLEKRLIDPEAERLFERLQTVIVAIRNTRAELNIPLESRPPVVLASTNAALRELFETHHPLLRILANVGQVTVTTGGARPRHAAAAVVEDVEVLVPLEGLIDPTKERGRLEQRVSELTNELARINARLADTQFASKAPRDVVEHSKTRRAQVEETLKKVSEHLSVVQSM